MMNQAMTAAIATLIYIRAGARETVAAPMVVIAARPKSYSSI